jgi:hypothetical protein
MIEIPSIGCASMFIGDIIQLGNVYNFKIRKGPNFSDSTTWPESMQSRRKTA